MSAVSETRRTTVPEIRAHKNAKPVVCLTCYHAHTARLLDEHVDLILWAIRLAWSLHGMENTSAYTRHDDPSRQASCVARGAL